VKITLTDPQLKVSSSKARFRVLISGRRFGKTYLCITEMMKYASKVKKNIWYVAPTFKMAREIVWSKLKEILHSFNWIENINESNLQITIKKTGSKISLKGCENYDSLRGTGLDFLILDEFADIDEKAWTEVLRASVADTLGDVLMCGSPKGYGNWAYRMYLKGQEDTEWNSFQFTTLQGGMVSKSEIEQAKQDIDIRTFRQEFEGTFENYAGAVYYNFHAVENIKEKKIDWSKPLHIGLDFNVDPMSASVAQIDREIIHFVDEIVIYSSNTDEMVEEIRNRYGSKTKIFVYPDPACRQRKTSAGGRTDLTILQNANFNVKCKVKHSPVRDRINAVNSCLKSADGKRYIYVNPSCKTIINGLKRQIYKENTNIPDKEEGFDHMNDSIGYLVEIVKPLIAQNKPFKPIRWSHK
jgi:phage terminase large subunit